MFDDVHEAQKSQSWVASPSAEGLKRGKLDKVLLLSLLFLSLVVSDVAAEGHSWVSASQFHFLQPL